jgi:hypothetical protein
MEVKMFRKIALFTLLAAIFLAACAGAVQPGTPDEPISSDQDQGNGAPVPAPWQPVAGDENLARGEVFIDSQDILVLESFPPQFNLNLKGSLPTPCHQLRAVVSQPDAQNRISVEVYSVVESNQACIQVLEPFEVTIPLGSYASGEFTVLVNEREVGSIKP